MKMVKSSRILTLNKNSIGEGPILYWMNRDCRIHDNWAYIYAAELAREQKVPLLVLYNLAPGFLGGTYRQHAFKVKGLQEIAIQCEKFNTPFFIVRGDETEKDIVKFSKDVKAGALVTDFYPVHASRKWSEYVRKNADCAVFGVDAHNIVPCWITSSKQEFAARTIRPKLHKLLPEFLEEFPRISKHSYSYAGKIPVIAWDTILNDTNIDHSVPEIDFAQPGYSAGMKALQRFIDEKLPDYAEGRNDPLKFKQSDLSPYLHYGQIAPQRVVLEVLKSYTETVSNSFVKNAEPKELIDMIVNEQKNGSGKDRTNVTAFIEELVVRRELADNFCFYNEKYDHVEGFPEWAQKTLTDHADDVREFVYTKKQFEEAKTHDPLWNAAQLEMVKRGKMAGYMRMYWAKKILEWTPSAKEALKIAIYLNDKYEIDGRDPNGYVGIAWSIGGVHDRPWFSRDVFGTVRFMARSGCEKKFNVKEYIATWT
jgi:deoxyribodipyrimidine photo-lyase